MSMHMETPYSQMLRNTSKPMCNESLVCPPYDHALEERTLEEMDLAGALTKKTRTAYIHEARCHKILLTHALRKKVVLKTPDR